MAAAVLYLPREVYMGGWLFSLIAMSSSYVFTAICISKLLEAREVSGGMSYKDIGVKAFGTPGRIAVEFFLVIT